MSGAEQTAQLARVRQKLEHTVLDFCAVIGVGATFRAVQLERFCIAAVGCTPGSPTRILRLLRASARIGYRVVRRDQSLYLITSIGSAPADLGADKSRAASGTEGMEQLALIK